MPGLKWKRIQFFSPAAVVSCRVSPTTLNAVNPVVKRSPLRESNERWKRKKLLVKFLHGFGAPVTGITQRDSATKTKVSGVEA